MLYVDLAKTYDTVPIMKLWEVLESTNINVTLINAIKELYKDSISKIKISSTVSQGFKATIGFKQGCCLSPLLLNIYLDTALTQWKRKCGRMNIPVGDKSIYTTLRRRSGGGSSRQERHLIYGKETIGGVQKMRALRLI